jgi:hypothetical protein
MSKIKELRVVTSQGVHLYKVGNKYNNLLLSTIEDQSTYIAGKNPYAVFRGYTENRQVVFVTLNAPVDVTYMEDDL